MSPSESEPYPIANLWRRLAALIYDAFLLFAIVLAYGLLLTMFKVLFSGSQQVEDVQPGALLQWLSFAGLIVALIGYYYICWRKQGQTLGMKSWRLKLQQADGSLATPEQCIKRSLLATLSFAFGGIGYLWCLVPPSKVCLHDIYSGTDVVVLPKTK
jgi:uncharacterized RDD family membrane protein YckC|tara:strand:- start:82 stop:552 length:471 start_codon:yes stop_codon:yes gene_type:complete